MDEKRIAVIFRADIAIPRGKAEVQFGHAIARLMQEHPDAGHEWTMVKLSLEVADAHELEKIERRANLRYVPCVRVIDAGRTVFPETTFTCIAIGPMDKTDCNALTRGTTMR